MKEDIETLTVRLDAMTGGFAALQSMLHAVVHTHPNPQQLSAAFEVYVQAALATHTNSELGDALLGGLHSVADHFRQQLQSMGTGNSSQS